MKRLWKRARRNTGGTRKRSFEHNPISIRVQYCGGCNPDIDRGAVVTGLRGIAASGRPKGRFTDSSKTADILLLLNGCPHACLEEEMDEESAVPFISVQGERIDCYPVAEERLPEIIWEKIQDYFLLFTVARKKGEQSTMRIML